MDFVTAFSFIVFLVLVPLTAIGVAWLGGRVGELVQAKVSNETLRGVLLSLDDAVVTAVKDLEQSIVADAKAAASDGKISREEARRIKDKAVRQVKSHLGPNGLKELGDVLGLWELSVEDFIGSKVEAPVLDLKRDGAPAARVSATTAQEVS